MDSISNNPYGALDRIFHEPGRLAIMSALIGSADGMTFLELKEQCDLTDGNLSRHLKALEDFGAVRIKKAFVNARPRTTVYVSAKGRTKFLEYLEALEAALKMASEAADFAGEKKAKKGAMFRGKPATA